MHYTPTWSMIMIIDREIENYPPQMELQLNPF